MKATRPGSTTALAGAALSLAAFALLSSGAPPRGNTMQDKSRERTLRLEAPPGAEAFDEGLRSRLVEAFASEGEGYRPRTRHLNDDGTPRYTNRLLLETSPYLLQHAHNPVNWFPWGDEAFETARRLGRPVFLSIGYSTCHWCHVMEEESFEDEDIARFLNEHYVAIKVDREERPDVDAIYMTAVQAMTGHGGWPMSVWLTPERKPFFAGTYFPARDGDRGASVGFLTLLRRLRAAWDTERDRVLASSDQVVQAIREELSAARHGAVDAPAVMESAYRFYASRFDAKEGGLRVHTKFPSQLPVRFLLRYARRTGDAQALHMAALTLEKMAAGGMYDHVGGGFHRYSTDPRWLVPHFEKMLYDNALLCSAYLEGYLATRDEDFARVAREILEYVRRDMTSPEGAFYSATDADSLAPSGHREEGYFFTWTPEELMADLGVGRAPAVMAYYAVTPEGDFEGRNILHTPRKLDDVARDLALSPDVLRAMVDEARAELYEARKERPAPLRDEKILAAWNGLMISAYAQGALVLDEPRYAEVAARAAAFVLDHMREGGRLFRSHKKGAARHAAYLDDYAFVVAGLLDLFEATGEVRWLDAALELDEVLATHYEDKAAGGFYLTSDDHEELLVREKPGYDGAEPSGNSIHALSLLRLAALTGDDRYRQRAERTFETFGAVLTQSPAALSEMLLALDFSTDAAKEIVIAAPRAREEAAPFLDALRQRFFPNRVLAVVPEAELDAMTSRLPPVAGKRPLEGKATAYVCEHGACDRPTTDPAAFASTLERAEPLR